MANRVGTLKNLKTMRAQCDHNKIRTNAFCRDDGFLSVPLLLAAKQSQWMMDLCSTIRQYISPIRSSHNGVLNPANLSMSFISVMKFYAAIAQ